MTARLKQQNRVQLSFPSIVKLFAIYGLALDLFYLAMLGVFALAGIEELSLSQIAVAIVLSPFVLILLAVFGYPFFALLNQWRGGLVLTIVSRKIHSNPDIRDDDSLK